VLSTESILHPTACDIDTVLSNLKKAFYPCKILITLREQKSLLKSFYQMHGQFGEYLYIDAISKSEKVKYPLDFSDWIKFQMRAPYKNLIGTLYYFDIVKKIERAFGNKNCLFLFYENFLNNKELYINELCQFLNINTATAFLCLANKWEHKSTKATFVESLFNIKKNISNNINLNQEIKSLFYENNKKLFCHLNKDIKLWDL